MCAHNKVSEFSSAPLFLVQIDQLSLGGEKDKHWSRDFSL